MMVRWHEVKFVITSMPSSTTAGSFLWRHKCFIATSHHHSFMLRSSIAEMYIDMPDRGGYSSWLLNSKSHIAHRAFVCTVQCAHVGMMRVRVRVFGEPSLHYCCCCSFSTWINSTRFCLHIIYIQKHDNGKKYMNENISVGTFTYIFSRSVARCRCCICNVRFNGNGIRLHDA